MSARRIGIYLGVPARAGGMFQYAQSMLNALSKLDSQKYSVTVVFIDDNWDLIVSTAGLHSVKYNRSIVDRLILGLSTVLRIPYSCKRILGMLSPSVKFIDSLNCEVWFFPAQEVFSFWINSKSVGTIHDLMHRFEKFPEVNSKFRFYLREYRFKGIAENCDKVLVDSFVGKDHVLNAYGTNESKIFVLPYVAPNYIYSDTTISNFDSHYKLPRKYIFYPAQFWPHKNHVTLLKALSIVKGLYPDIALVLSGARRHDYNKIKRLSIKLGLKNNIDFVGYVPDSDMREFYLRARALIYPTYFGPTNIPPLEALVCNCPMAVSNIYGMPDQLGDAALYFDPSSVEQIADVMKKLWVDNHLCIKLVDMYQERRQLWNQDKFNSTLCELIGTIVDKNI